MANSTTNLSLTKPESTDTTKIREDFNDNMDLIDAAFSDVLAYDTTPVLKGNLTSAYTFDLDHTNILAAGLKYFAIDVVQGTNPLTGTLRGLYVTASNGALTSSSGTIRGIEVKARTAQPGETGGTVGTLEGISISADSKDDSVTTMRGMEVILDGSTGGTVTEGVGIRIANNMQADKTTTMTALQIYADSFAYDYGIDLSQGAGGITTDIKLSKGETIINSPDGTITLSGNLALGAKNLTMTGSIADTTNRVTKGWFTDLESTNDIAGSITGNAETVTLTDNESTNEENEILFAANAAGSGDIGVEGDGDLTYNPSTGTLTATKFKVYRTSETAAIPAGWFELSSNVVTGDVTGLRTLITSTAASGGDAASGQNTRGIYGHAKVASTKHAGLLQGGLFVADASAGNTTIYNVHVLGAHYSSGGTNTIIAGDLYVGYLRAQTRSTNPRSVTGHDCLLALENEAIEGSGAVMDSAIRIFDTNVAASGFTYGIDLSDADYATADINLNADGKIYRDGTRIFHTYADATADGRNIFIGEDAGNFTMSPAGGASSLTSDNVAIGYHSLNALTTGHKNVAMGKNALADLTAGHENIAMGFEAGSTITTGTNNFALGTYALHENIGGNYNVAIGTNSLRNCTGSYNVGIGQSALYTTTSGDNVAIGFQAGKSTTGLGNIFIGKEAGENQDASNQLFIENSNAATPLIYGEFDNDLIRIYGKLSGTVLTQTVVTMGDGDTTPTVAAGNVFISQSNTGATAITDLDNPTVGQIVTIICGHATNPPSIADGGNFKMEGNWTSDIDDSITFFVKADNYYIELSRSAN